MDVNSLLKQNPHGNSPACHHGRMENITFANNVSRTRLLQFSDLIEFGNGEVAKYGLENRPPSYVRLCVSECHVQDRFHYFIVFIAFETLSDGRAGT